MDEKMLTFIKNKDFDGIKSYFFEELVARYNKYYKRGMMTEDDLLADINKRLCEVTLSRRDIFKEWNYDLSQVFVKDYYSWKNGAPMVGGWEQKLVDELSDYSEEEVFKLIDAVEVAIEIFRDIDPTIPAPKMVWKGKNWWIEFDCADDDGMLAEPSPEGKEFCLQREDGIIARVKVCQKKKADYGREVFIYKCEGTIEHFDFGYKGDEVVPQIIIEARNNQIEAIYVLAEYMSYDSEKWKEYELAEAEKHQLYEENNNAIIAAIRKEVEQRAESADV